ncbi:MAG: hypothetical protein M9899_01920 [Bdellovibrionaceae bacterium]|nr:hypothetical protein [Pseudobdellovibrionaceae bacterium]
MRLSKLVKKAVVSLLIVHVFATVSYANLSCVVNGDFVPFPWSDQTVTQVLGHQWPLLDTNNQVESKIAIQQLEVYFTRLPIFVVREYSLDNRLISLGTGWQDGDSKDSMAFRMYNYSMPSSKTYDFMTVRFGNWIPKAEAVHPETTPPYLLPLDEFVFPHYVYTGFCPAFSHAEKRELFGLVIEKDSTWNAERKDIYFSFDPIRN